MQDISPSRKSTHQRQASIPEVHRDKLHVPARSADPKRPVAGVDVVKQKPSILLEPSSNQTIDYFAHSAPSHREKKKTLKRSTIALKPNKKRVNREKSARLSNKLLGSRHAFSAVVAIVLMVTGYVSVDTWLTNRQVEEIAQTASVAGASVDSSDTQQSEGKDETPVTPQLYQQHNVGPDEPRYLTIEKLGIKARVISMGLNRDGSIQAPMNVNDSGWYEKSVKPGVVGAVFLDGHAAGQLRQGLFAYLDTLKSGDRLSVETGDGTVYRYEVLNSEITALEETDMRKALLPQNGTLRGLNLMTCIGKYIPEKNTYDQRLIVYTKQLE